MWMPIDYNAPFLMLLRSMIFWGSLPCALKPSFGNNQVEIDVPLKRGCALLRIEADKGKGGDGTK
jgi:hypothetical protein